MILTHIPRILSLLVTAALTAALTASPASAATSSPPTAPFHECPAVGLAASCQLLLVVNVDRSITVLGDPYVGPYDGADDTLVGVINNSRSNVPAITVTGAGTGLSLFDGDGLCAYLVVSGCPYGVTGYEGPGTTLVTNPNLPDSVEVDFSGTGLAPGGTSYFGLEGVLTSAQIVAIRGTMEPAKGAMLRLATRVAAASFDPGQDPGPAAYVRYTLTATYSDGTPASNAAVKLSNASKTATFHTNSLGILSLLEPVNIDKKPDLSITATVTAANGATAAATQQIYSADEQVRCTFPGSPQPDLTALEGLIADPVLALVMNIFDYVTTLTVKVNTTASGYEIHVPGSASLYALGIDIRSAATDQSVSTRLFYGSHVLLPTSAIYDYFNRGSSCGGGLA